ncbi:MAG: DNA-binding response regulator [Desulfobulbaceae bacterium DB1]|nr:MAG: DNA-binding response regulator [Desulfobulbaceae bacterium DB1]
MKVRIAIVDDHAIVREGLRRLLADVAGFEVAAEAASGLAALGMAEKHQPDVIVMDISMPDLNGIEATREIMRRFPRIGVVILSVHATCEHVFQALSAGARGYVLKESVGRELVDAIRAAYCNIPYLSDKIDTNVLSEIVRSGRRSPLEQLSCRERQVLHLVVNGASSAVIAEKLALSPKTVETYRSRIMQKLGVRDITALVKFAIRHGVISVE